MRKQLLIWEDAGTLPSFEDKCDVTVVFQRPRAFRPHLVGWERPWREHHPSLPCELDTGQPRSQPEAALGTGQSVQAVGLASQGKEGMCSLLYSHRARGVRFSSFFAFIWFPNGSSRLLMFPPSTKGLKEKPCSFLEGGKKNNLRELSVPGA